MNSRTYQVKRVTGIKIKTPLWLQMLWQKSSNRTLRFGIGASTKKEQGCYKKNIL
jgi:hypothetical protein